MPLYEFECKQCHVVIEVLMKISDPPPLACTACNSDSLSKIISRSTFTHSGQGWYKKSYAHKNGRKARAKGAPERAPISIDDAHYHPENAPPVRPGP